MQTNSVLQSKHTNDTDMSSAQGLPSIPPGAKAVLMQATGQNIRYTLDGTTPTSSKGFLLYVGADPTFWEGDLSLVKVLEEGTSAVLEVSYFS